FSGLAFSQVTGDYRSAATGNWSDAATWEMFDGANWVAAGTAPTGTETIAVDGQDTVKVDVAVTIAGYVKVVDTGIIEVTDGSLEFADGSTYEHARDAGSVPTAVWQRGSTALFTDITGTAPDNRGQDYYNLTLNTPDLSSNRDLALEGHTISGDFTVVSSGSSRWRLVGGSSGTVTIMGDVIVETGAQLETQGTSSATDVVVNHHGNLTVTGGNFSISRGSQGSGIGTTTWNLFGGDFTFSDGQTRNSNPTPGNAKLVFAGADTQRITFTNVEYGGGDIHFKVADSSLLVISEDFEVNGLFINEGEVIPRGALAFLTGSVYEHARDGGDIPIAAWNEGSTYMLTGTVSETPGNRNQNFYNITLNTPNLSSNKDLALDDVTIGGDIHVISSGTARWRLTSASGGDTAIVNIMGDLIVEGGSFETQGTGNALTTFIVNQYGNINVTNANFSVARGSQGNGSGTTTWNLFKGDFTMSNGETKNSNPTPGNAKLVFACPDSQQLSFTDVSYGGGQIHFKVSDSTKLKIAGDFSANGLFINEGEIEPLGTLTFLDGAVYEHARDGGSVPTATWAEGSTALFTGITGSTPENRGQDYYNLTLNTPGLSSNRDMSLDGHTIGGNLTLLNSGSSRWRLVGGSSGVITIMGDVIVVDGSLETQGTSSQTEVVVNHHGNVNVTGGTFAVSRGSQGGESGTGSTKWYLLEGDFSISNATTRNSNPWRATFIFAKEAGIQNLTLSNVTYDGGGLPIQVDSAATLNMDTTAVGGNGNFILSACATLASAHPTGIDGNLQTSGELTFSKLANFTFNGQAAQVPGMLLPDTLGTLTIANPEGVSFNDTLSSVELVVSSGAVMKLDTLASVTADSGSVAGTVLNKGALAAVTALKFEDGSVYEHARDEGSIPNGVWNEGSTLLMTGTTGSAPGNRNQNYYNIILDTPNLVSNRDLGLDDVTIGGNIKVVDTGASRWRLTSASAGDTSIVTIMGDVIVEAGAFETQGTGNALTVFEVHHYGNVVVTGGNFSVARGSQGNGSGSTRWFMHKGDFSMKAATTQNSNADNAWFVFDSQDSVQTLALSEVTYGGGGLAIEVANGTTLDFGLSELGGNGLFVLDNEAALATAHEGGIASAVQTTGAVTFEEGANYIFNGTTAQVTSTLMPMTVNGLAIKNEAGVKLSQETTINGVLRLMAGVFDNTIPFTLGPDGSISYEGGSLLVPTSVEEQSEVVPTEFAIMQNYPNPFNPSTTIRYDIPREVHVTLTVYDVMGREVAVLVNQKQRAAAYEILWNADGLASGEYLCRISAGDFVSVRKFILMK
ncbi:T9SS type A sorting domain-containing protein, partial [candidate division KSB1 bacterium]|nr:T9SS type A sorting domain-containing protein [candidate division KSB1 bacterium]